MHAAFSFSNICCVTSVCMRLCYLRNAVMCMHATWFVHMQIVVVFVCMLIICLYIPAAFFLFIFMRVVVFRV